MPAGRGVVRRTNSVCENAAVGNPHPAAAWTWEKIASFCAASPQNGLPNTEGGSFCAEKSVSNNPVSNPAITRLLEQVQHGNEKPQTVNLCGHDDCRDQSPVTGARYPNLAHKAHLGLPGPVSVRTGMWTSAWAGFRLCGGYTGFRTSTNGRILSGVYPVHYGRGADICAVLFPTEDHRGKSCSGEFGGQFPGKCGHGGVVEHNDPGWRISGLVPSELVQKPNHGNSQEHGYVCTFSGPTAGSCPDGIDSRSNRRPDTSNLNTGLACRKWERHQMGFLDKKSSPQE